jgi:hypothetical protein
MRQFNSRTLYLWIGITVLLVIAWGTYRKLRMPDIPPHVGDGRFRNISWRFPWKTFGTPVTGYEISFAPFDLSNESELSYSVENLADIGKTPSIYFCVEDPNRKLRASVTRSNLRSSIEIDVIDEKGASVCHVKDLLSNLVWTGPEGGKDTYCLYSPEGSQLELNGHKGYRIQVRYSSDPQLQGFKGFIYIRCGGSI